MPRFLLMGLSRNEFWNLTPQEMQDTLKVYNKIEESKYDKERTLAYMSAIMLLEGQNGKFKSFNHYFPNSKLGKSSQETSDTSQIKINMLNYANAINSKNARRRAIDEQEHS